MDESSRKEPLCTILWSCWLAKCRKEVGTINGSGRSGRGDHSEDLALMITYVRTAPYTSPARLRRTFATNGRHQCSRGKVNGTPLATLKIFLSINLNRYSYHLLIEMAHRGRARSGSTKNASEPWVWSDLLVDLSYCRRFNYRTPFGRFWSTTQMIQRGKILIQPSCSSTWLNITT